MLKQYAFMVYHFHFSQVPLRTYNKPHRFLDFLVFLSLIILSCHCYAAEVSRVFPYLLTFVFLI